MKKFKESENFGLFKIGLCYIVIGAIALASMRLFNIWVYHCFEFFEALMMISIIFIGMFTSVTAVLFQMGGHIEEIKDKMLVRKNEKI